ncbi:MAG: thioredoxin family protein [Phycisphaerales bacterium]
MPRANTVVLGFSCLLGLAGCATTSPSDDAPRSTERPETPPPRIQAWMDRLTVEHAYDPETGFIVAKETVGLPAVLTDGPPIDEAVRAAGDRLVIAVATADRCAPCQQYKKDALNDPRVIERLQDPGLLVTHVEVDRTPELVERFLGSRAIPMTYAIRDGRPIATLRGQRSADDLLSWLDEQHPRDASRAPTP